MASWSKNNRSWPESMYLRTALDASSRERVVIVGIGGLGCHLVASMSHLAERARLVTVNTDRRGAIKAAGTTAIQLGTQGTGTGSQPALARSLATQHLPEIKTAIANAELAILVTGLGKGTGSGATPVVAECARALGAHTFVLASLPEDTASPRIILQARATLAELQQTETSILTLQQGIASRSEYSETDGDPGSVDLEQVSRWCQDWATQLLSVLADQVFDFGWDAEDFKCFLNLQGRCAWGAGAASGPSRAAEALTAALASLRETSRELVAPHGQVNIIVAKHVPHSSDILHILNQTCLRARDPEAYRIFYAIQDDSMQKDELRIHLLTKAMPRRLRIAATR